MESYTEVRFGKWKRDDVSVTLRNHSGSCGGGSEALIVVDDEDIQSEQPQRRLQSE